MIYLEGIGEFEKAPQIVIDIVEGNIPALDKYYADKRKSVDKKFQLSEWTSHSPLELALMNNCFASVKWLVEHGANLNTHHSFLVAVRYCQENIIRYLVEHGAKVVDEAYANYDPYEQALFGEKIANLPLIHELGYQVEKYGVPAFRQAVMDWNYEAVNFFISHGVDINDYETEFSYPKTTTALCLAARFTDLKMCKHLVKHGADVTIPEKGGMRPYHIALERGYLEMADYFKSLEPTERHDLESKLSSLKLYKLPDDLIEFLQGEQLRLHCGTGRDNDVAFIDFFSLADTLPMKIKRGNYLRISSCVHGYDTVYVLWSPKLKQIVLYDYEHEELKTIAPFDDFIKHMGKYMKDYISGN